VAEQSVGYRIVRGFMVVVFFWLFWKFGGFLVSVVIARTYGPGAVSDAYNQVYKNIIFLFLFSSFLKVVVPAFMPIFIEELNEKGAKEAWDFAASVINLTLIASVVVAVVGMIYAGQVVDSLVPGFGGEARDVSALLLRWMLPGSVGLIFGMLTLGVLNSYKVFSYPAAADAAQKFVWAVVLFVCARFISDARAIAIGFGAGCLAQVIVCMFGLGYRLKFFRPTIPSVPPMRLLREVLILAPFVALFAALWHYSGGLSQDVGRWLTALTASMALVCVYIGVLWVRARRISNTMARFVALACPLVIGVIFARYRDLTTFYFQSFTKEGVFGDMEFAKTIANMPVVLVAYSLSVALFPYLCEMAAKKDLSEFGSLVTRMLKMVAVFFVPLAAAMMVLDREIIQLVYDKGNWSHEHIQYAGLTLSLFAIGLIFNAIENVTMQSFFSMKMTWQPTVTGIAMDFVHVGFLYLIIQVLKRNHPYEVFFYVALSLPLSRAVKNIALLIWMRLRVKVLPLGDTVRFLLKLGLATAVMAFAMVGGERAVNKYIPIDRYKPREVLLDTFNREPRGWFSLDAQMSIASEAGRNFLRAEYDLTGRRTPFVRRDLTAFKLEDLSEVIVLVRTPRTAKIAVELTDYGRVLAKPEYPTIVRPNEWIPIRLVVPAIRGVKDIQVADVSLPEDEPVSTSFAIGEVQLVVGGQKVIVDSFTDVPPEWQSPGSLTVDVLDPDKKPPEAALRLGTDEATRSLTEYDLSRTSLLTFKAASPAAMSAQLTLVAGQDGYPTEVAIRQSEKRLAYSVPVRDFRDASGNAPDVRQLESLKVKMPTAGAHLDNVGFVQSWSMRDKLRFEFVKLLRVGLPTLLGGIVLVVIFWLLRIEELTLIMNWLREEGLSKIRGKLGRGKKPGDGSANA